MSEEKFDYLEPSKYEGVKRKLSELDMDIPSKLACIYDLWQDYILSDEQEEHLYRLVDPEDKHNDVTEYWNNMDYDNPLLEVLR